MMGSCENVVANILNVLFTYARLEVSYQAGSNQPAGTSRRHVLKWIEIWERINLRSSQKGTPGFWALYTV